MKLSIDERFAQSYIPVPESGCWLWAGSWDERGYGTFSHRKERHGAHRWGWTLSRGAIPAGLFVCHKCDTPACVNPDHLFLGTHIDNVQDMIRKGRQSHGSGNQRVSAEMALAVRDYPASLRQTAVAFGISPAAIRAIRQGKSWRDEIAEIEGQETTRTIPLTKRQIEVLGALVRLNDWAAPALLGEYPGSHHAATANWLADQGLADENGGSYHINSAGSFLFAKLRPTAPVKVNAIPMSCDWCGKSYMVSPSIAKRGWGRFCSRSCKSLRHHHPTTTPESN